MESLVLSLAPLAFLALVYAVAFGWRPPTLNPPTTDDRERLVDGDLGRGSGLVGAFVAATTAANVSGGGSGSVHVLVALLAILVAWNRQMMREVVYALLGVTAALLTFVETLTGACGQALPSVVGGVIAVIPAVLLVAVGAVRLFLLPGSTIGQAGRLLLAVVAVLHLGALATYPAGVPVVDAALGAWAWLLPPLLLSLLAVVALGCGLRPAIGADLTALGIVVTNLGLGVLDTPCGLALGPAVTVAMTFLGVLALTRTVGGIITGR